MEFTLAQVQEVTGAQIIEPSSDAIAQTAPQGGRVRGWSIDSRTLAAGDLFFAIKGDNFDGHEFVDRAVAAGAVAAIVSERQASAARPLLLVSDTLEALQSLAQWSRRQWAKPVVAVTGSAGKTSTKDIIVDLLGVHFQVVGRTVGNFNNHIGLPLSILRIPDDAEVAVLELGMNHAGEIRSLAAIAEPQIGVVTNVGFAHMENFDSIEGVAAAKQELIESLPLDGAAVLNADDERVTRFRTAYRGRVVTYGFSVHADVRAERVDLRANGSSFVVRGTHFETRLSGRHAVSNILAGLAVADIFGIGFDRLVQKVGDLVPGKMRGERHEWNGVAVLNDSYNSNPEATRSMIDVLRAEPAKRRIAVLGEMLELGPLAESLHRDVGSYAARAGVDVLVGVRGVSRCMVEEAKHAGLCDHAALFFEDPESAGMFLKTFVRPGDAVLFKGSRGTHVERAIATMEA